MPQKRTNVKNEKQYEALKDKGMSKERAAKIANSPGASSRGGRSPARAEVHPKEGRPRRRRPPGGRAARRPRASAASAGWLHDRRSDTHSRARSAVRRTSFAPPVWLRSAGSPSR